MLMKANSKALNKLFHNNKNEKMVSQKDVYLISLPEQHLYPYLKFRVFFPNL